ncbi:serine/threonine-protein kinase [Tripterygium wilfordii]|uniref:Serine/threonine-protein kinase n=1 Tax=Tripterygium wilfordii TaxID=458696 RepID=A0A7J7D554_TRIWF|nr:serine/threonine-protein kinase [Tripterygium wilfordii]
MKPLKDKSRFRNSSAIKQHRKLAEMGSCGPREKFVVVSNAQVQQLNTLSSVSGKAGNPSSEKKHSRSVSDLSDPTPRKLEDAKLNWRDKRIHPSIAENPARYGKVIRGIGREVKGKTPNLRSGWLSKKDPHKVFVKCSKRNIVKVKASKKTTERAAMSKIHKNPNEWRDQMVGGEGEWDPCQEGQPQTGTIEEPHALLSIVQN